MGSLRDINAVDIRMIKRFPFLEPIPEPHLLQEKSLWHCMLFGDPEPGIDDAHSLGNPEEICKLINAHNTSCLIWYPAQAAMQCS